jgi:hypothetical protein
MYNEVKWPEGGRHFLRCQASHHSAAHRALQQKAFSGFKNKNNIYQKNRQTINE